MNPAPAWHAVAALAQSTAVNAQIDLNTVLLTILLGLGTWTLVEVHRHGVTLGRVMERVWGTDGKGGHDGEIQKLKADMEEVQRAMADIRAVLRMKQRRNAARVAVVEEPVE